MTPLDTFHSLTELARIARGLPAGCTVTSASVGIGGPSIHVTHEDPAAVHRSLGATAARVQPGGCVYADYAGMTVFVSPPLGSSRTVTL